MKCVKIGAGAGMIGDRLDPIVEIVQKGNVDYIAFDNLGEITIADLQRRKLADPTRGYGDVTRTLGTVLPGCRERDVKIITNAGGINPVVARQRTAALCRELGLKGARIASVEGDDTVGDEARQRIRELQSQGVSFRNMDTGEDIATVADRIVGMVVYLGAPPIVEALRQGANVILTGRYADPSLWLAPLAYEFGWAEDDWDRLALGIIVGQLSENSGQVCGGGFTDWRDIPDLDHIGYPIAEVYESGEAVITKVEGSGGMVSRNTVRAALTYETTDPTRHLTPDVVADFTSVTVEDAGPNRVRVRGARGKPAPETLKAVVGYRNGFITEGYVTYAWPDALEKAERAAASLRNRIKMAGVEPLDARQDFIGAGAVLGPLAPRPTGPIPEIMLRTAIRTRTLAEGNRFLQEVFPMYVGGPPGACGVVLVPPREVMGAWPALVPRELCRSAVTVEEVD